VNGFLVNRFLFRRKIFISRLACFFHEFIQLADNMSSMFKNVIERMVIGKFCVFLKNVSVFLAV